MEKSIENIWKDGFLKSDALVAPAINNLYGRKSIHIIDKFKRMFKVNLIAIVAFTFIFLILSYLVGIPIMGAIFFVALNVLVFINKRLLRDLENIDKGESSYQYLKAFNSWINAQVKINERLSRVLYPIIFLSLILGFWFKDAEGAHLGERLIDKVVSTYPTLYLVQGIPLVGVVGVIFILVLLAFLGKRIYRWDLNLVYGKIFKKLKTLLDDIEELKR